MEIDLTERLRRIVDAYADVVAPLAKEGILEAADAIAAKDTAISETVLRFANAVLHGDDERRAWLLEAATAFNAGQPLPPPNGKGRAEAAEAALSEMRAELERVKKALILTPMAERVAELPHFMAALAEWGCTDPNEQAVAITDFLNSLVGLREYLSDGLPTPTPDLGVRG